jgi:hypothetical protein
MLKNLSKKVDEINRPTKDYAKKTATNLAKFHISANLDCAELMNRAERREFKRTGRVPLSATRVLLPDDKTTSFPTVESSPT